IDEISSPESLSLLPWFRRTSMNRKSVYISLLILAILSILAYGDGSQFHSSDSISSVKTDMVHTNLPWSEYETSTAADIFSGKALLRQNATETNFQRFAPHAQIIHLATHAVIDDQNPLDSRFVLADEGDSQNDGLLHTFELYNMQLNSQLAVLSSCNTGVGKLIRGEGILSMARGFRYAGCSNIVMSLWQVDDQSSAHTISRFYHNLSLGMEKSEALHEAKLHFIDSADPLKAHPYFWSGLILIGDNAPLEMSVINPVGFVRWLVIFVLSALLVFLVIKKYRKSVFPIIILGAIVLGMFLSFCEHRNEKQTTFSLQNEQNQCTYLNKARQLVKQAYFDSSRFFFEQAAQQFLETENWGQYLECLTGIGETFLHQSHYDSAGHYFNG
ncbi:MAG: CHAT domain-containing protein, partial [bacterium]|nr:CHAT domain-containing protein [bacterium]